jgi:hypothetical protein
MTATTATESNPFDPSWPFTPDETMALNAWLKDRGLELHIGRSPLVSFVGYYRGAERVAGWPTPPGGERELVLRVMARGLA